MRGSRLTLLHLGTLAGTLALVALLVDPAIAAGSTLSTPASSGVSRTGLSGPQEQPGTGATGTARACITTSGGNSVPATCVTEHIDLPPVSLGQSGSGSSSELAPASPAAGPVESCYGHLDLSYDNLVDNGVPSGVVTNIIFDVVWECKGTGSHELTCGIAADAAPGYGIGNVMVPYVIAGSGTTYGTHTCAAFTTLPSAGSSFLYNVLQSDANIKDDVTGEGLLIGPYPFFLTPFS